MAYEDELLNKSMEEYPFIRQHNPIVSLGKGFGYAETWPTGEEGASDNPRPKHIPIDRHGITIHKPEEFSHHDLAAELLHVDPIANKTRNELMKSWTPKQLKTLKEHALDWQATLDEGRPEEDAISNATDSALRGYTVGQWPEEVNKKLNYNKEQLKSLENLKNYMKNPAGMKSGGLVDKSLKGGTKLI
jgi:hypothetical protein